MGFILFLIAFILYIPLTIINIIVVLVKYRKRKGYFKIINEYFKYTAIDIDRFGNRNFRALWNSTLVIRSMRYYPFGDERETISSTLGKNKLRKTLSRTGRLLAGLLDLIDKNHCVKSIREL